MRTSRVLRALTLAACAGTLAVSTASAQSGQGSISGRVTETGTSQPIEAAHVMVAGTNLRANTNAQGLFTIPRVPAGQVEIRVLRVGYTEARHRITVSAGQEATIAVGMTATATTLNPVVTTATGDQRRIELGNAVAWVDAAKVVEVQPVANVGDLLLARIPGVSVAQVSQSGAQARIRIRGATSISLLANPIYVIDGIRIDGDKNTNFNTIGLIAVGGTQPSRVNEINPDEIESIEIVRGPSAATLYGTDAANGVIRITTKRGQAGAPKWRYYTEQTAIKDRTDHPTAYTAWRRGTTAATTTTPANAITVQCFLLQVAAGTCTQDSVTSYNLFKDPYATPLRTGYRGQHGLQVSGGNQTLTYFLTGEWEAEDGVTGLPQFDRDYLTRLNRSLLPEQEDPNAFQRITTRGNFNIMISPKVDLAVSVGYTNQDTRLIDPSFLSDTYNGPGIRYNVRANGDTLYGWRTFTPRTTFQKVTNQSIDRLISSATSNWRPTDWLTLRGNFGLDHNNRRDTQLCRFTECNTAADQAGVKIDSRAGVWVYTADANAMATRRISETIVSQTTAGVQFNRNLISSNAITGRNLAPGAQTIAGTITGSEATDDSRTLGGFIEQQLSLNDRLFLTGAVRTDRNSAFGKNFPNVYYPKASLSWVVSEEPFIPEVRFIDKLRLRAAYGQPGVQPTPNAAYAFYSTTIAVENGVDRPALVLNTFGNPDVKPERSAEWEAGFDADLLNNRLSTEITYYRKKTKDALINQNLPASTGGGGFKLANVGSISYWGWEALVTAQMVQRRNFAWEMTLNGSHNDSRVNSLGAIGQLGGPNGIIIKPGFQQNTIFAREMLSYKDANNDGIIAPTEVVVSDTVRFIGVLFPKIEAALSNSFDLFNRRLRFATMFDYKGGHRVNNNTDLNRCATNCAAVVSKEHTTLYDQARTVAARNLGAPGGYFEKADFIRFRELSATGTIPERFMRPLRATNALVTLAVRNVAMIWTEFTGPDPEAFSTAVESNTVGFGFAPPTYFTLRLSLGF